MRVMLRIDLPDSAEGDNQVSELVNTWLHADGLITIITENAIVPTRITYVKEQ